MVIKMVELYTVQSGKEKMLVLAESPEEAASKFIISLVSDGEEPVLGSLVEILKPTEVGFERYLVTTKYLFGKYVR